MHDLRTAFKAGKFLVLPSVTNALEASLARKAGFSYGYMGGWAMGAVTAMGEPLLNVSDVVERCIDVSRAAAVAFMVDAGAGWGSPAMIERALEDLARAGASAVHIEDLADPAPFGTPQESFALAPLEQMLERLAAAYRVRERTGMAIVARTNAARAAGEPWELAIERAQAYGATGADAVIMFPRSLDEIKQSPNVIKAPMVFVASEGRGRPLPTISEIEQFGYRAVVFAATSIIATIGAVSAAYDALKAGASPIDHAAALKVRDVVRTLREG